MRRRLWLGMLLVGVMVGVSANVSYADPLTIYDVQYSTAADGASPYDGTFQDVVGGIVTEVKDGFRYVLQDPAFTTGWGGIVVKDWTDDLANAGVQVGDWVSFTDVYVEDNASSRGMTQLMYDVDSGRGQPELVLHDREHGQRATGTGLADAGRAGGTRREPGRVLAGR